MPSSTDFVYHITTYRAEAQIDATAAYMNLIAVLNDLAFSNKQEPLAWWHTYSLPEYSLLIEIKSKEVRFAVWGVLNILMELYSSNSGLYPLTMDMAWKGTYVGEVHVLNGDSRSTLSTSNSSTAG